MVRLDFNHILRLALGALSLTLIAVLAVAGWQGSRTQHITLAAGASSGESYILGNALKTVVERHYPKIRITVLETGGTVENLTMLQAGGAQLATAQADIPAGSRARSVAVLYDDTFQLLVAKDSPAQGLVDLRGKRIALAQSGGQFQSFLHVAEHFGLRPADFQFVGTNDEDARVAFLSGRADAIFRVRAVGDPSIRQLVESVLIERRQEIMHEIPSGMAEVRLLLVQTRRPELQSGLGPALHPGAISFYDRDKPSFLLAHADYVGLILTVGLMAGSWIRELKRWMQRQQKNQADIYSKRVVDLISDVQRTGSLAPLDDTWGELLNILTAAVHDLDADKLSEESFNSFRAILQIGMEVTKERRAQLMVSQSAGSAVL
jgi:NMT1-like family